MLRHRTTAGAKPLNIMIVGLGKVGVTLVEQLSKEGNIITIIDKDPQLVNEVVNVYDVMGYNGNGASYGVLKEADIDSMDLFIAVTESDELNLLCCTVAKKMSDCATIARVRDPDYSRDITHLRERLGLAMIINPEFETASETARILNLPSALEVNSFAHGEAEMIKFRICAKSPLVGKSISDYSSSHNDPLLFCAIERDEEVTIASGDYVFADGDIVSFVAPRRSSREMLQHLGLSSRQVHDCLIVGGGESAFYLADQLSHAGVKVSLIEKDKARCDELSLALDDCIIVNGDGTDEELLREEGLESVEAFVPLTNVDEENILLTLHARQVSEAKVITKINRFAFKDVIDSLDLGSVVYPRYITSEAIIAYARARRASIDSNIETLYHMFDHRVEAIEFHIRNDSEITGTPIRELSLKKNVLVTFISRNGSLIFPSGDDTIEIGDTVMVVTTNSGYRDILDILN